MQESKAVAPVVTLTNNHLTTTSLNVAEVFNKQHAHVIRDIENLKASCPKDFHESNFGLMSQDVQVGNGATRKSPMYLLTRDGLTLLVMGYTGKEALKFKLAYIEAFNRMEEKLKARQEEISYTPYSDNDMIIQDLYTMVARNLRGKDLDAQIALRERVKAAFECKPLPATETAPALPESNGILPLEGPTKQNVTERSVIRFLRDGLHSLNAAYQHAGLLVNTGKCPIKGFRRSLYIACMSNINGAAAIVRAMIAAEEIPAAKR